MKLGKLIPDLFNPETAPPRSNLMSKGGILARACDYLSELRAENEVLTIRVSKLEKAEANEERLESQIETLKAENEMLRRQLEERGMYPKDNEDDLILT